MAMNFGQILQQIKSLTPPDSGQEIKKYYDGQRMRAQGRTYDQAARAAARRGMMPSDGFAIDAQEQMLRPRLESLNVAESGALAQNSQTQFASQLSLLETMANLLAKEKEAQLVEDARKREDRLEKERREEIKRQREREDRLEQERRNAIERERRIAVGLEVDPNRINVPSHHNSFSQQRVRRDMQGPSEWPGWNGGKIAGFSGGGKGIGQDISPFSGKPLGYNSKHVWKPPSGSQVPYGPQVPSGAQRTPSQMPSQSFGPSSLMPSISSAISGISSVMTTPSSVMSGPSKTRANKGNSKSGWFW